MEWHRQKPTEEESKEKCEVRILNANCEAFMARRVERSGNMEMGMDNKEEPR